MYGWVEVVYLILGHTLGLTLTYVPVPCSHTFSVLISRWEIKEGVVVSTGAPHKPLIINSGEH